MADPLFAGGKIDAGVMMSIILIGGAVLCGWVMLSLIGAERQRRIQVLDAEAAASKPPAAPSAL